MLSQLSVSFLIDRLDSNAIQMVRQLHVLALTTLCLLAVCIEATAPDTFKPEEWRQAGRGTRPLPLDISG